MDLLALLVMLLTLLGTGLGEIARAQHSQRVVATSSGHHGMSPGAKVLVWFGVVVIVFGMVTANYFWDAVTERVPSVFFLIWLLLAMILGMFVQVLRGNHESGRPLFDVTISQVVYPLLFSVFVFAPIWSVFASGERSFFLFMLLSLTGSFGRVSCYQHASHNAVLSAALWLLRHPLHGFPKESDG